VVSSLSSGMASVECVVSTLSSRMAYTRRAWRSRPFHLPHRQTDHVSRVVTPHRGEAERGQGRGRRLRCRAQSHATAEDVAPTADLSSTPPSPVSPYEKAWAESVGAQGPPAPVHGKPLLGKHKWLGGAYLNGQIIGIPAHAEAVIRVPHPPRPQPASSVGLTQHVALILARQSWRHTVEFGS
jgi:hypothetical protein